MGSMLADAVSVSVLREDWVKACFYGRNRSGKTSLACEGPKPLLLISTEPDAQGGASSVSNKDGVRIQRVSHKLLGQDKDGRWMDATDKRCVRRDRLKGTEKLTALLAELGGPHPFKTVVLDTATSYQELVLVEIMGWDAPPAMHPPAQEVGKKRYQYRAEKWRQTLTPLLDLDNCHVFINCQEKDHNQEKDDFGGRAKLMHLTQDSSFMAPAVGSTNAEWLETHCGYIMQLMEMEVTREESVPQFNEDGSLAEPMIQRVGTGKRQRHLRMLYHPNYQAGGRWNFDPNMPEFVTAPTPTALYQAMAKFIPALAQR